MRTFKIGSTIYHESRYWKMDDLVDGEVKGWNARYLPYIIVKITPKLFYATGCGSDGKPSSIQLPRGARPKRPGHVRHEYLEADGRQYHSRFHEYFYAEIPKVKPAARMPMPRVAHALLLLGISPPYSDRDVKRAYKRLALKLHPDQGGNHLEFIRLTEARDVALRGY